MAIQAPVPATPFGPAPNTNDPDNFDDLMDARLEQEGVFGDQMNALGQNVFNNATEAQARALQAQQAAADAASAASAAAASTTAVKWTAGTYGDGVVTWSPTSRFSYRHIGSGASAIDPALDPGSWVLQLYALGLGGMSITGSVDLIVTSGGAIFVTPATPGLYITLPDATTLTQGAIAFHAFNAGVHDMGVRNKAGVVLGWIRPGSSSVIGLASNATVAGVWVASNLQKLGVTASLNIPSMSGGYGNGIKRITVDANRTLFLFGLLYAVVYDSSNQQWGAPVLLSASGSIAGTSGILIAPDKVLVVSIVGGSQVGGSVLTLSGTSIALTATPPVATSGAHGLTDLIAVGAGFAFGVYNGSTNVTYVRALTVSGTAVVFGNEATVSSGGSSGALPVLFTSGSVLRVVALTYGSGVNYVTCTPYTLSGANLVVGTPAVSGVAVASVNYSGLRCFQNGNGNIVVLCNAGNVYAIIFKLTGTTEAYSASVVGAGGQFDYVVISGTKTAVISTDGANAVYWNIHVDTAGTGSAGTMDTFYVSNPQIAALGASGNNARFAIYSATEAFPATQLQVDCSAASPVRASTQSRWNVNTPRYDTSGKASRHFSLLSAGSNQYAIGGQRSYDGCFNATGIQALPTLGENWVAGVNGAAANESWILTGVSTSIATIGTTIKRIEAAA
jgi:hypothetical protein